MDFFKAFLRNLVLLFVIAVFLMILMPDIMSQVFGVFGGLFGPAAILLIIIFALPGRSRRSSRR